MRALISLPSRALRAAVLAAAVLPAVASAWWNPEYTLRTKIVLNTSSAGVTTAEPLSAVAVPVRLHSGNFDFLAAKPDGSDLRFVAGDDKTPLKFTVERYDSTSELAVVWVQVPAVAPGSDKNTLFAYAGNAKAGAEAPGAVFDASTLAAFHFADKDGPARDHTGAMFTSAPVAVEINGLIGPSGRFDGLAVAEWPYADRLKAGPGGPYTVTLWAKPAAVAGTLFAQGPLSLGLEGGKLVARLGNRAPLVAGGDIPAGAWAQLGLVLGSGKATLYVNGVQAAQADVPPGAPAVQGPVRVGERFTGLIDELQIASAARSADWMKFNHAAQGADAKLMASMKQAAGDADAGGGGGGEAGYIGVLVKSLTLDAKVVIGILAVMFAIALWVMASKAFLVRRTERGNHAFLSGFRDAQDVLAAQGMEQHPHSSLARLYQAGVAQLAKRGIGRQGGAVALNGASLDAVKAAIDADLVRENHRLNALMVLLTIAISGGPFLGLLGTVVGVMITFAAIAAAGDVNVNAIAPGIAAALLATVAGLGVAIPSLFGYNYLASRIKNISADMQIFVDEFVTRVAESYGGAGR